MMKAAKPLLFVVLCGAALAGEAPMTGVTVQAHGLRIVKPAPGGDDKLRAFNWFSGTSVSLLITAPQGGLLEVDRNASKLTAFTDDKGKDLTKAEDAKQQRFSRDAGFSMSSNISEDGKVCVSEVDAPGVPSKGATVMTVTGTLVFRAATKKKDFTAENVALKAGSAIKAGSIPLTITKVGKPEWGGEDDAFAVTLEAKQDLSSIAGIEFFDAAGKKVESRRGSSSSMSFGDSVTITWEYNLKNKLNTAKIVISYWMDMKKLTVPVDLKVGLGM
jgi:hypothetical protein